MRGIRAGRLKDRLMIQVATESSGDWGGIERVWVNHTSRPCEIRPLRGAEFFRAGGENVEVLYEIRFRYERGLFDEAARLVDTRRSPSRIFDIEAIVNTGNWNSEFVVTAVERRWPIRE